LCAPVPAVNDVPSFNVTDSSISVDEDSDAYSAPWASAISAGAGEQQNLTFSTQCGNATAALFSVAPHVSYPDGVLSFTPASNAFGSSSCTVTLAEAGEGGLSYSVGLTIEVLAVNDPPSFTAGDATITVDGDSDAYSAAWATAISGGPGEQGQELAMSILCRPSALFSVPPAISADGVLSFTPAATKSGSTNCTVTLSEQGDDGLRATAPVTIVVSDGESAVELLLQPLAGTTAKLLCSHGC
jgi:hypothetical protein